MQGHAPGPVEGARSEVCAAAATVDRGTTRSMRSFDGAEEGSGGSVCQVGHIMETYGIS